MIDIEKLLEKISEAAPSGENLEYDPSFQILESVAAPKVAQQFGDIIVPAEKTDWNKVQDLSIDILYRTKDLRITANYLANALVHTEGFLGCSKVLLLVAGYLELYWETVHPVLEADDEFDPTTRLNAIGALSDRYTIVQTLRQTPLISVKGIGRFTLRDMDIAAGKVSVADDEEATPPSLAAIEGVLMEVDTEELQNIFGIVGDSLASIKTIRKLLMDLVGIEQSPQFDDLSKELSSANAVLEKELLKRGISDQVHDESDTANAPAADLLRPETGKNMSGEINSRNDVIQALDKICDYYTRNEPSSPVPLLLQRAKQVVTMDFMDIMKSLASDGLPQAEKIMGMEGKKTK